MEESQLIGIINRLKAMQEDAGDEPQPRRFERDGVELAQVVYHADTQTYSWMNIKLRNILNLIISILLQLSFSNC